MSTTPTLRESADPDSIHVSSEPHPAGSGGDFFPDLASDDSPGHQTLLVQASALVVAGVVLFLGGSKLGGATYQVEMFRHWGYAIWTMYALGAAEVFGAVLFARARTRPAGAVVLLAIMLGSLLTSFIADQLRQMLLPGALLVSISLIMTLHERNAEQSAQIEQG